MYRRGTPGDRELTGATEGATAPNVLSAKPGLAVLLCAGTCWYTGSGDAKGRYKDSAGGDAKGRYKGSADGVAEGRFRGSADGDAEGRLRGSAGGSAEGRYKGSADGDAGSDCPGIMGYTGYGTRNPGDDGYGETAAGGEKGEPGAAPVGSDDDARLSAEKSPREQKIQLRDKTTSHAAHPSGKGFPQHPR